MISTVFAISACYAALAFLLLVFCLKTDFVWWVKAGAIVATTAFAIAAFFATRGLLSYPSPDKLPGRFQLLWARVVEPDPKTSDPGAVFLWVEELDTNNVPDGMPRAFKLVYSRALAEKSGKARDAIMGGNPQEGTAEDLTTDSAGAMQPDPAQTGQSLQLAADNSDSNNNVALGLMGAAERVDFKPLPPPLLPPKT
ncbi:MAG TPA: hypothetical protein VG271_12335 [Beijerinckiaceae bacterium]|jgi:hypothetical protein|nr:hypothetical protein [Beijerinckiaceae bacterium]